MLSADILLSAYRQGIFPMADNVGADDIFWLSPDPRAILPLDQFHTPRRLKRTIRHHSRHGWRVTLDRDFANVMKACANTRENSWINQQIFDAYNQLFALNYAHSVEVWRGAEMVGGLYGVSIGGAFFGESMFSTATDASKMALVALVGSLRQADYTLLDVQFQTNHLKIFGVTEIPRLDYLNLLQEALIQRPQPLQIETGFF